MPTIKLNKILFLVPEGIEALKGLGIESLNDIKKDKTALEYYNEYICKKIEDGQELDIEKCHVIQNALRLAIMAKRQSDARREKVIAELMTVYGMTRLTADALIAIGTKGIDDLDIDWDKYAYSETWRKFQSIFKTVDLAPTETTEIWKSLLLTTVMRQEPPKEDVIEDIGPPGSGTLP